MYKNILTVCSYILISFFSLSAYSTVELKRVMHSIEFEKGGPTAKAMLFLLKKGVECTAYIHGNGTNRHCVKGDDLVCTIYFNINNALKVANVQYKDRAREKPSIYIGDDQWDVVKSGILSSDELPSNSEIISFIKEVNELVKNNKY